MSTDWMTELAAHYEKIRDQYPQDRHMILFDIDGTILDSRFLVPGQRALRVFCV